MDFTCRTCLKISSKLTDIFADQLPQKIEAISTVQIAEDLRFPSKICDQCVRNVHLLYDFRSIILRSHTILQERHIKDEVHEDLTVEVNVMEVKEDTNEVKVENVLLDYSLLDDVEIVTESNSDDVENKMSDINKEAFACKHCDFTTAVYDDWRCHKRTHKEVLKSVCNICGKSIRVDNLKKHISIHTETPVACKICGKVVKNMESLRGHLLIHKGNSYQCTVCGKVYKHRGGYNVHLKRHALGDAKTVECSVCGKFFFERQTLAKHMRSHTGERPYPCQYCKKGFSSSHALKTHIRRHTNEKPYACEFCDRAFPQRVSLRTHITSRHSDKIKSENSSYVLECGSTASLT